LKIADVEFGIGEDDTESMWYFIIIGIAEELKFIIDFCDGDFFCGEVSLLFEDDLGVESLKLFVNEECWEGVVGCFFNF
jgi:hypothetical protein